MQDDSFTKPLTVCDFTGGGHANSLEIKNDLKKDVDLWLMVVVSFV